MATIIKNEKGFKVIECSLSEITSIGGLGICDFCNKASFKGYYIAVLNQWYGPDCYNDWIKRAKHYDEDKRIELKNYKTLLTLLNVSL